ncbi:MAG TPA: COX15/CtaA family protein [Candidatus Limnocylindria bacterium]|nr:COX15/CtaA family protein [Candidatus Limnocylindria bacterium]
MLGRVTVGLFFVLLIWGNLVAGLKAGLACPDWPLCHGKILPPFRVDIYLEFLHRVIAAVAGVALVTLSYRRFRAYRGVARIVPVSAVSLLLAEIVMGGAVVLLELPIQLTTVHFVTGLFIFLLAYYMMSFDGVVLPPSFSLKGYPGLFFGMGVLVFLLAAMGAYVRHAGAGLALPDWPTSLGGLIPGVLADGVLIQFSHRVLAVLVALTIVAFWAAAALDDRLRRHRRMAVGLFCMILAQIAIGGAVVLTRLYFLSTALHLAVALVMLMMLARMWVRELSPGGTSS